MEYAILMGTMILAFLLVLAVQHRQWTRKMNLQLLREFNLLENDKKRIASDLHDEIAPYLMLASVHLGKLEGVSQEDDNHLQKSAETIDETIQRLGEIVSNIYPYVLEQKGLKVALQDMVNRYEDGVSFNIEFNYRIHAILTPVQKLHIYRLVQEIVQNTLKHAEARRLELNFEESNGEIVILTIDDGLGMPDESLLGLGSMSIRSRVDILQGSLDVVSIPNGGTTYHIEIPLKYAKDYQGHHRR